MVSNRCKMAVKEELKKLGLHFIVVDLGEVDVMENITMDQRQLLKAGLLNSGFELNHDYTYLSNLFSEVQGTTIEHFIISHKTERVKELIIYGEHNITEIAWKMGYSSVAHLSSQFKKVTGLTPSHFKNMKDKRRCPIEEVGIKNNTNTNSIN